MGNKELCNEIKMYFLYDKTNTAFMINGSWGSGKTFYIKNTLINFLENQKIGNIYIPLFGINSIQQLSKTIFIESRFKKMKKIIPPAVAIGKNFIVNGLNFLGLKLDVSEKEIESLYKKINVKNKLIIFDDLERCCINFKEILGYINYLVEFCFAKVLIICDEKQIDNKDFFLFKEKVIGRTVNFIPNLNENIKEIFKIFCKNKYFKAIIDYKSRLNNTSVFEKISLLMETNKNVNLRTLMLSCQNACNIFSLVSKKTKKKINSEFLMQYFLGIYNYHISLINLNNNSSINELKTYQFPLFNSAKNYIQNNNFNFNDFINEEKITKITTQQVLSDFDISVIYNFVCHSDSEIMSSLDTIYKRLDSFEAINPSTYLRIIENLLEIKKISTKLVDFELIKKISDKMLLNLANYNKTIQPINTFSSTVNFGLNDEKDREFLIDFQLKFNNTVNASNLNKIVDNFSSKNIDYSIQIIEKNIYLFIKNREFFSLFKTSIMRDFFIETSQKQFYKFIMLIAKIYNNDTILSEKENESRKQISSLIISIKNDEKIDEMKKFLLLRLEKILNQSNNRHYI